MQRQPRHLFGERLSCHGAHLHLPLWQADYESLGEALDAAPVDCIVSAVDREQVGDTVSVGEHYNAAFRARLPAGIDQFGENGEFHTLVHVRAS